MVKFFNDFSLKEAKNSIDAGWELKNSLDSFLFYLDKIETFSDNDKWKNESKKLASQIKKIKDQIDKAESNFGPIEVSF